MKQTTIDWCIYWAGIGFIVGCLFSAMSCASPAQAGHRGDCGGNPPACEYGEVAVCWCATGADKCAWFCVSDGKDASCE